MVFRRVLFRSRCRAGLARCHAADHLGAIGKRLVGVEGAGGTGHPLGDDLGILVDQDRHNLVPFPVPPATQRPISRHWFTRNPVSRVRVILPRVRGGTVAYARLESRFLQASSSTLTASTDTCRPALSAPSSSISPIFSTPPAPICTGTTTSRPSPPYSPSHSAAPGRPSFWWTRTAS